MNASPSDRVLQAVLRKTFGLWETFGIHITPSYFESPIPDTRFLKDEVWSKKSLLAGIDLNEKGQINLLEMFASKYRAEYDRFPRNRTAIEHQYYTNNSTFAAVDGEVLYCMVRHFKPRRIYEVGSGNSTLLSAQAIDKNSQDGSDPAQLVAFEPAPNSLLRRGFRGLSRLVVTKVEDVPIAEYQELKENDIWFVDSSHVLRTGGDVQFEYLEVLPQLRKGVIVHIHDIFLPAEYPKRLILERRRFFSEQYLLQAFLSFNNKFEVLWAGSFMHMHHPDLLEATFKSYDRVNCWPGSFWIRRVAD